MLNRVSLSIAGDTLTTRIGKTLFIVVGRLVRQPTNQPASPGNIYHEKDERFVWRRRQIEFIVFRNSSRHNRSIRNGPGKLAIDY